VTRRARRRGYTVVELMMALAVFTTGVTGVIAMERTVIASNRHARNLTVANGIAQAWLDQLVTDSSVWQANLSKTLWLKTVADPGMNGNWQLPAQSPATVRNFGPTFNVFGKPDATATDYCVHIRLTWLDQSGAGSIRTEVRVFWPRDGATRITDDCASVSTSTVNAIGTDANDSYFFVYQAGAVAQHPDLP
jgi:type IV pilus assembly protein PilV